MKSDGPLPPTCTHTPLAAECSGIVKSLVTALRSKLVPLNAFEGIRMPLMTSRRLCFNRAIWLEP